MAITGIGSGYNSGIYESANAVKNNETSKTDAEKQTRRTTREELSYLTDKYECLKSTEYSVSINSSLLEKAASDEKTSEWLEYNLSLIPSVVNNIKAAAAANGAKLVSCSITMDGYDSMTTEVCVTDVVDPGTEKAKEELKQKIKEIKEEKKAREEKAAKRRKEKKAEEEKTVQRRAEKKAAEKAGDKTGEYTMRVTETDIKAAAQKIIAASFGTSAPSPEANFDIKV